MAARRRRRSVALKSRPAPSVSAEVDGDIDVEERPDGSAVVRARSAKGRSREQEHFENLAEVALEEHELNALSVDLMELVEIDKRSREKRDKQYAEGLQRTGIGEDAPGGASFQGASKVAHPLLAEATIDFTARTLRELLASGKPVKDDVQADKPRAEEIDRAERKAKRLNKLFRHDMPEFVDELRQTISQMPLGGSQYISFWREKNRLRCEFYPIDQVFLPYAASSYRAAERRTHVDTITRETYEGRVRSGMYRDLELTYAPMIERTKSQTAADRSQGAEPDAYNKDGLREIFRVDVNRMLLGDKEPVPYVVHIDESTRAVLAVYRNWRPEDRDKRRIERTAEFCFFRWRGAYGIGLLHMIGGLAGAATGALRALLDSAHINNMQTAVKLKGGSTRGGESVTLRGTEVKEIDGVVGVDDIRKTFMPLPFNPPSPVLFELLGFLVDAGRGMVRTTLDEEADGGPNTPVGTMMARVEEGTVVFGSIYGAQVASMGECIRIVCELLAEAGEEEFADSSDVAPSADPNVFSEQQRMAALGAVQQRDMALKQLQINVYNTRKVELRWLERLKVQNPDELLNPVPEPERMNAVNENAAMMLGRPVTAFPDQNHEAHLATMLAFSASPLFGQLAVVVPQFVPGFVGHLKEHLAFWYVNEVYKLASDAAEQPFEKLFDDDPEVQHEVDATLAEASHQALTFIEGSALGKSLPPIVAKAQELLGQLAPPNQEGDALMAEVSRKTRKDQQDGQLAHATLADKQAEREHKAQLELAKVGKTTETTLATTGQTNQTKLAATQMHETAETQRQREGEHSAMVMQERAAADARAQSEVQAREAERGRQQELDLDARGGQRELQGRVIDHVASAAGGRAERAHSSAEAEAGRVHETASSDAARQHELAQGDVSRKHEVTLTDRKGKQAERLARARGGAAKKGKS